MSSGIGERRDKSLMRSMLRRATMTSMTVFGPCCILSNRMDLARAALAQFPVLFVDPFCLAIPPQSVGDNWLTKCADKERRCCGLNTPRKNRIHHFIAAV